MQSLGARPSVGRRRWNVDGRAGHRIGQCHGLVVDVEGDGLLRELVAGRVEPDLGATSVELRIALVGLVKSKKFGTDEVVAALETIGHVDAEMAVVGDQLLGTPLASGLVISLIPDLEPAIASALVVDSRVDFLEINSAGSLVRDVDAANRRVVGPVADLEAEGGTAVDRTDASNALGAIDTAGHVAAVKAGNGIGGGVGISGHANAGAIALSLAIDIEFGKERVCVDALCSHQGEHRNDRRDLHGVRRGENKRTVKAAKRIRKGVEKSECARRKSEERESRREGSVQLSQQGRIRDADAAFWRRIASTARHSDLLTPIISRCLCIKIIGDWMCDNSFGPSHSRNPNSFECFLAFLECPVDKDFCINVFTHGCGKERRIPVGDWVAMSVENEHNVWNGNGLAMTGLCITY
ncbi:glycoside hydrolase family 61 protein, partial [Aureobasidium sp. EXF-3399]